jgi:hypothetical protein
MFSFFKLRLKKNEIVWDSQADTRSDIKVNSISPLSEVLPVKTCSGGVRGPFS